MPTKVEGKIQTFQTRVLFYRLENFETFRSSAIKNCSVSLRHGPPIWVNLQTLGKSWVASALRYFCCQRIKSENAEDFSKKRVFSHETMQIRKGLITSYIYFAKRSKISEKNGNAQKLVFQEIFASRYFFVPSQSVKNNFSSFSPGNFVFVVKCKIWFKSYCWVE